jgi:hypothetical protein
MYYLTRDDRNDLELLDRYMRGCLEAFFTNQYQPGARRIVLLDDCLSELAPRLRKLNGEASYYIRQSRKLSKCVLPGADVVEAFHTTILEHQKAVADF